MMIKKTRIYFIFIFILWIFFHSTYCAYAGKTAMVIKSQNLSAYNKVIEGFEAECIQNNITIKSMYDLNGKMKIGHKTVRNIREEKPDVVLTIGVLATTIAKEEIKDIPIVFCMVINHERFQLAGSNISGIAAEIAIEKQMKGFQTILNPLKNIGVIYDPSKTGNIVESAETKVKDIGMNLVKYEVNSTIEVPEAIEGLTGRIDALWLLPDSTVVTKKSFDLIKSTTLEKKIPLLCTSDVFVKAGALTAVFSDYKFVGRQAAQLAGEILERPSPGSLGIVNPDSFKLAINTDTAEKLGLKLEAILGEPHIIAYP
jgi:putative tryptophan/tyrosine transport system substrate-binding protein